MPGIEKNGWKLVLEKSGEAVEKDGVYYDFRNEASVIFGGEPPHKEGASGYVWSERGESYASVFGMEWVKSEAQVEEEWREVSNFYCANFSARIFMLEEEFNRWKVEIAFTARDDRQEEEIITTEFHTLPLALRFAANKIEELVHETDFGPMPFGA